jgi:hypothetical protein
LIDNLDNIVVGGYTDNYNNFIASFTESGTINYSMVFDNGTYGGNLVSLVSTSDNGIVALSYTNSDNYGCIQVTYHAAYVAQHIFSRLIQLVLDVEGTLHFL